MDEDDNGKFHLPQQIILPTSTRCDTLLYRAKGPTILNSQIPRMSRVARPANQRALDQALTLPGEPGQFHLWPGIGQGS